MIVTTVDPTKRVLVTSTSPTPITVEAPVGRQGIPGPPGPPGTSAAWDSMTQAQFDALPTKDPDTLYVIIG